MQSYELAVEPAGAALRMAIRGRVEIANAQQLLEEATRRLGSALDVHLDLSGVGYFDSGGGIVVLGLRESLRQRQGQLTIVASTPAVEGFLSLVDEEAVFGGSAAAARRDRRRGAKTWPRGSAARRSALSAWGAAWSCSPARSS